MYARTEVAEVWVSRTGRRSYLLLLATFCSNVWTVTPLLVTRTKTAAHLGEKIKEKVTKEEKSHHCYEFTAAHRKTQQDHQPSKGKQWTCPSVSTQGITFAQWRDWSNFAEALRAVFQGVGLNLICKRRSHCGNQPSCVSRLFIPISPANSLQSIPTSTEDTLCHISGESIISAGSGKTITSSIGKERLCEKIHWSAGPVIRPTSLLLRSCTETQMEFIQCRSLWRMEHSVPIWSETWLGFENDTPATSSHSEKPSSSSTSAT